MKTARTLITFIILMLGGFYISVTFLGKEWDDQWDYLLVIFTLIAGIVVCAGALLGLFKLVGWGWNKLIERQMGKDDNDNE